MALLDGVGSGVNRTVTHFTFSESRLDAARYCAGRP
jgi:hypothetical protein